MRTGCQLVVYNMADASGDVVVATAGSLAFSADKKTVGSCLRLHLDEVSMSGDRVSWQA
jgi:hypothetical protein